jgi:hypothetical protein
MNIVSSYKHFLLPGAFLGAFTKFRKASISFVMPVLPSVLSLRPSTHLFARNNSGPTGRIFVKFDI